MDESLEANKLHANSVARNNYNKISRWYDLVIGTREKQIFDQGVRQFSSLKNGRILEIGCGTGNGLVTLSKEIDQTNSIFGLDLSEGMLRKSKQKFQAIGLSNIQLQQAHARFLPYEDYVFSGIILGFTLELFPDEEIPLVLAECERILQPAGRIVVIYMAEARTFPVDVYRYFHHKFPTLIDCKPIDIHNYSNKLNFDSITITPKILWGLAVNIAIINYNK